MNYTIEEQINFFKEKQEQSIKLSEEVLNERELVNLEITKMIEELGELPAFKAVTLELNSTKLDIRKYNNELQWLNSLEVLTDLQLARKIHVLKQYSKALTQKRKCYRTLSKFNKKRISNLENQNLNPIEQMELWLFPELSVA